ncbi:MAG: hypothetical protein ACKO5K_02805 [Armatimonadota bacterium]
MNAGAARCDITPPKGVRLSGFAGRDWRNDGVRDPVEATALWMETDGRAVVVLSLDIIGVTVAEDARFRAAIGDRLGIDADNVLIACTHNHAGPATMGIRATGGKETGWTRTIRERCIEAAVSARHRAEPVASIRVGSAPCAAAVNRRHAEGPSETKVRVLMLCGESPIASLFHTAMHPVCRGNQDRLVSADWVGVARNGFENETGAPALALQGCCGDINPRVRDAEAIGREVARSLSAAVHESETVTPEWNHCSAQGAVPLGALPSEAEIVHRETEAERTLDQPSIGLAARQLARADLDWAKHCRGLRDRGKEGPTTARFRTMALRIGPVVLAGLPGEVFQEIGQRMIERDPQVWPVGFAAGNLGYLYPDSALDLGGYEVDLAYRLYGERQAERGTASALQAVVATTIAGLPR